LSVLIVEDSESDAEIAIRLLRNADYDVKHERVETAGEMRAALKKESWDVVISDYSLPEFDAPAALAVLKETAPDTPFIVVVSGVVGEEAAVAMMRAGAHDYLAKDNLARLAPAVAREIREARTRRERQRAEEKLRESESRYRRLIDAVTDYIYAVRVKDGRVVEAHHGPGCEAVTGYTSEEFAADSYLWLRMVVEDDRPLVEEQSRRLLRNEDCAPLEHRIVRKDGAIRWVQNNPVLHRDVESRFLGYDGLIADITARKQAENALRESEADLARAQSLAHVGSWEWWVKDERLKWSDEIFAIFDFNRDDIPTFEVIVSRVHPEDRERNQAFIDRMLANSDCDDLEFRVVIPDGTVKYIYQRAEIRRAADGSAEVIFGTMQDITDRKEIEEALRKSEAKYRELVENINDIIFTINEAGRITYISPVVERTFGYSPSEIEGLHYEQLVHADDIFTLVAAMRDVFDGRLYSGEFRFKDKSGACRWVRASIKPLAEDDRVVGLIGSMTDINERKRAEEALKESEERLRQSQKVEAIGRLAGGVAHDFNNLLGIIGGHAEITKQTLPSRHSARQRLDQLLVTVDRAGDLTRQLLAFSRKQTVQRRVVGLNGLVSDVQSMLERVIGEDVDLRIDIQAARDAVRVDPGQIEQALLNFAVNARDAMPRGGVLSIAARNERIDGRQTFLGIPIQPGPYYVLEIRDTGCGISGETSARIFEPFFTTKPAGKGTGLGLATVYGIVRQSAGYVDVESVLGEGTTFRVYLPLCEEKPEAVFDERPAAEDLRGSGRVLIVEDEEALREILAEYLRDYGYTVLTAAHGEEALERARMGEMDVELLVTDVVMPLMGGLELADGLAEIIPGLRVLFMSGYSNNVALENLNARDVPFLEKPFTSRTLAQRVLEAMRSTPHVSVRDSEGS
ncbi:MAG: PAS domain S-box protein, partial [Vicinamibacteria bacterium]|nr:PAS domain S-box protein [Vicinamibacteria bacterium]